MSETELLKLIDLFLTETQYDEKYGFWVQDARDKNYDVRVLHLPDFRNWLKQREINAVKKETK